MTDNQAKWLTFKVMLGLVGGKGFLMRYKDGKAECLFEHPQIRGGVAFKDFDAGSFLRANIAEQTWFWFQRKRSQDRMKETWTFTPIN